MAKLIKYLFTGGIASLVDFGLFATLVKLGHWPWFLAGCVSFASSTIVGYAISIKLVFTSGARFTRSEEMLLVFLISGIGLGINQGLLYLLIHNNLNVLTAKIGASIFVVTWNFVARSQFIFKKRPSTK